MKGLYSHGTLRRGRAHVPQQILYTPQEAKKANRGNFRFASELNFKIACASWIDGNEVNVMSNADGTDPATIERQVGKRKETFPTLKVIVAYCKYMQGVDRIDQYRSRMSIADGHSTQKRHKKLAFAYIDFTRTNAFLTRKLFCSQAGSKVKLNGRDPHREVCADLCAALLDRTWKDTPDASAKYMLYQTPLSKKGTKACLFSPRAFSETGSSRAASTAPDLSTTGECEVLNSRQAFPELKKKRKRMCKVCRWESRPNTIQTGYCSKHDVSLCLEVHPIPIDIEGKSSWCPDHSLSWWKKYHLFYLPSGLYSESGAIKKSHPLHIQRKADQHATPLNK